MAAFRRRGLKVAPFKIGPDFIDPGHHTMVTGVISRNLDGWMLSKEYNQELFLKYSSDADIAIVEGVMGLFDGYDGKTEAGSTAQMAKWLDLPVLLVVNARSMARSAAALVQGFEGFDSNLKFIGVIFNHLGSPGHLTYLKDALQESCKIPCLGGIARDEAIGIPERHLGLITGDEHPLSVEYLNHLTDIIEASIDLDNIAEEIRGQKSEVINITPPLTPYLSNITKPTIGIARDKAFCFYYQDNLDMLKDAGAELVFFSPLKDKRLPDNLHGLYFGGGYPELFADILSENRTLIIEIREKSQAGMPIYAECGGFMYLCRGIVDIEGKGFPMVGCFPFTCTMQDKLSALGYREITLTHKTLLGDTGENIKGHEFHYSEMIDVYSDNVETVYAVADRKRVEKPVQGYQIKRTLGSYIHLHFGSNPKVAENFIKNLQIH